MNRNPILAGIALAGIVAACAQKDAAPQAAQQNGGAPKAATGSVAVALDPRETHLSNVRQVTFGGENAEAYWSADGQWITFQSTRDGRTCDQQYVMRADGSDVHKISAGGKTTCGYFYDGDRRLFFGSTHAADSACPPRPDPSAGYVWPLDPYDIFTVKPDGSDLRRLTNYGTYTAEGVMSHDGKTIVFTSLKDGDLDIYTMSVDGTNVRQLTNTHGYDGGPWWSPDGKQIVYRAHHTDSTDRADYDQLLARHLVRPSKVELYIMNADGSNQHQITHLGGANFGPSWTIDGRKVIFASNYKDPHGGNFDLFLANLDGSGLEQITFREQFDGFPMFSPDGKHLIWASNRFGKTSGETNLFLADWNP